MEPGTSESGKLAIDKGRACTRRRVSSATESGDTRKRECGRRTRSRCNETWVPIAVGCEREETGLTC